MIRRVIPWRFVITTRFAYVKAGFACFLTLGLLACSGGQKIKPGHSSAEEQAAAAKYRIAPGDILFIEVVGEKDCSGSYEVTRGGTINLCYLGAVEVAAKSISEARDKITQLLKDQYLNNPQVTLDVNKFRPKSGGWARDSVRVLGEVSKPGIYPLKDGYTVLDIILEAGGFTEFASPNKTRIVRIEGDEKREIFVRVKDVMKSGDRTEDSLLKPGDTVVVPEGIL